MFHKCLIFHVFPQLSTLRQMVKDTFRLMINMHFIWKWLSARFLRTESTWCHSARDLWTSSSSRIAHHVKIPRQMFTGGQKQTKNNNSTITIPQNGKKITFPLLVFFPLHKKENLHNKNNRWNNRNKANNRRTDVYTQRRFFNDELNFLLIISDAFSLPEKVYGSSM